MNDGAVARASESVSARGGSFARLAAIVSPFVPLVCVAFNAVLSPQARSREAKIIVGSIGILIIVAGFILAFLGLRGARRYGAKGVRGFAIAGLVINGIFILVSIVGVIVLVPALRRVAAVQNAGYTRAEMEAMPEAIPGSHKIIDETIGFRLEIPGDFVANPAPRAADTMYSFIRIDAEGRNFAVNVNRLGGRIRGAMTAKDISDMQAALPAGSELQRGVMPWKTHTLESFAMRFPVNDLMVCTHLTQVPLSREAIQITVGAPMPLASECRDLLALLLTSLQGLTPEDAVERIRRQ